MDKDKTIKVISAMYSLQLALMELNNEELSLFISENRKLISKLKEHLSN